MRLLTAALIAAVATSLAAQEPKRPEIRLTTKESFDASSIRSYARNHAKIYAHIDANRAQHLAALQRWLRQRSISAENDGIAGMAAMLRDDLTRIGFREVEIVPTAGHPGVVGFYDGGAKKTLVVYMMYDVQPVEREAWRVDPFAAEVVDHELGRVVMARGATNQKGPQRAFLNAVESILAVDGKLPVNLIVLAEGEEELGSPHFPEIVARYEERLGKANGVLFPANAQDRTGGVNMTLGVKGIVYFELEARGGANGGPKEAEIHGSWKATVDSPVWRLTQALATLTTADGNTIAVPGYYDAIRPPNAEEQRLVNGAMAQWRAREAQTKKGLGIERWIDGWTAEESQLHYLFDTTLNIDGIYGGYAGPGSKTILPHRAVAKLDSRLVPNQTPEGALGLIEEHLKRRGFGDIVVRKLSGYPPAQTSIESPLVRAAIGVYNKHGLTPAVSPRIGGSAPYYVFTERLKLPMVSGGIGHGSGAHAPNEYMVVEPKEGSRIAGLAEVEKFYVDLLFALGE